MTQSISSSWGLCCQSQFGVPQIQPFQGSPLPPPPSKAPLSLSWKPIWHLAGLSPSTHAPTTHSLPLFQSHLLKAPIRSHQSLLWSLQVASHSRQDKIMAKQWPTVVSNLLTFFLSILPIFPPQAVGIFHLPCLELSSPRSPSTWLL